MSYRPTISIYLRGELAEVYLLMNTEPDRLREFTFALALYLDGCQTTEQIRQKLKMPPAEEHFLKDLELSSEDPFVVDLTARCIYVNYSCLKAEDLARTRVMDLGRTADFFEKGQFAMPALYIPFQAISVKEVRASHAWWHFKNK